MFRCKRNFSFVLFHLKVTIETIKFEYHQNGLGDHFSSGTSNTLDKGTEKSPGMKFVELVLRRKFKHFYKFLPLTERSDYR